MIHINKSTTAAWLLVIALLALLAPAWALDGTNTPRPMDYSTTTSPHYGYMEYLPAGYASTTTAYPLVIFLHGIGERGNGTSELTRVNANGPPKLIANGTDFSAIVISPQAPPSGVAWFWDRYIVDLITYCKTQYRVDPNRVYLTGISAGGGTAWYLPDEYPGTVCALGVICGADEVAQSSKQGAGLRRLPIWAFQNNDDGTVAPGHTQRYINAIIQASSGQALDIFANKPTFPSGSTGSTAFTGAYASGAWNWSSGILDRSPNYPMFTLYANGGHDSWSKTYDNPLFWQWLFAQQNRSPTISDVTDRAVSVGGNTGDLAVTIDDPDLHPDYLVFTATSSNTNAVPLANLVRGGSGGARTVRVTGAATGTATITLTVSDGSRSVSDTFVVTVGSGGGNTAPTISAIADQSVVSGASTGALAFTIADAQTAAGSLVLSATSSNPTLVPTSAIVFGGANGARTVTVTPAGGQSGTATITVTVSDGSLSASEPFAVRVSTVNTAPTISAIADQSVVSGSSTAALAFTIADAQTAAGSLVLSATSSNPTLVPTSAIVFGGANGARLVTVTPASGQSGTATITVTVSDGSLSASEPFVVTVSTVNTAPTISAIADQSVVSGSSTAALAFTIADAQTAAGSLVLSATSSNPTLVPTSAIVFGGANGARLVTVTPASGLSGTATITVTVSDGSLSASEPFVVTVSTVNTAPTISAIADRSVVSGASTGAISFTIADAQTAAGSLVLSAASSNPTLVPTSAIVFGGANGARTVTVTPAGGQSGTATITVTVSDGSLSASEPFVVTVTPGANSAPTLTALPDRSIHVGGSTGVLTFTIGDAQTPASSLVVTAASSQTGLVPLSGIVLGGSGASRTVVVTPAGGQSGQAVITIVVSDGLLSTSDSFLLKVNVPTSSVSLTVNFQPTPSTIPANMVPDNGKPYANRGVGYDYGWNADLQEATRDRNFGGSPSQAHDTLIYVPSGAVWEIALPNGSYEVRVVAGDPAFTNGVFKFSAEGVPVIDGSQSPAAPWLDNVVTVTVSDGKLTLTQGAGAQLGKICFIEILSVMANG